MDPVLTVGAVARLLAVSETCVRKHDQELQPVRASSGARLYSLALVEQYAEQRAARRALRNKSPAPGVTP